MKYRTIVPVLLGAGLTAAMVSAPAVASASTTGVSAKATHHKSAACKTPRGQRINISWGDGNVSTTVYYNNHCNQKRAIELDFRRSNGTYFNKCFVAPARKKGHKKIQNSMPYKVTILPGGSC